MRDKILKIVRNEYLYSILTKFITVAISLAESVILARYLGASLKGTSAYISRITSIGSTVITFGMHQAYPYLRKKYGKDEIYEDYMSAIVVLYLIYMVVALIVGLLFISDIEIKAAILMIPLMGYTNVVNYVCLVETPNKKNTVETISTFVYVLFLAILWLFTKSTFAWAVVILAFSSVLRAIVFTAIVRPRVHIHKDFFRVVIDLFSIGFFPMLALLMTTLNYQIDVLMLKQYTFITAAQIGVYSIGISVSNKMVLIPDTLKGVMVSKLAKGADEKEVARVLRLCLCAGCMLCIVFLILGNWVIGILYGNEYAGAYEIMAISAIGAVMIGYFKLIAQYNIVNGNQKYTVGLLSISIVLNVILNLLFIPRWNANGAALATCLSHIACGFIFSIWFSRKGKVGFPVLFIPQKNDFEVFRTFFRKN